MSESEGIWYAHMNGLDHGDPSCSTCHPAPQIVVEETAVPQKDWTAGTWEGNSPPLRLLRAQMALRTATNDVVRASAATSRNDDWLPLSTATGALYAALAELHTAVTVVQDSRSVR